MLQNAFYKNCEALFFSVTDPKGELFEKRPKAKVPLIFYFLPAR